MKGCRPWVGLTMVALALAHSRAGSGSASGSSSDRGRLRFGFGRRHFLCFDHPSNAFRESSVEADETVDSLLIKPVKRAGLPDLIGHDVELRDYVLVERLSD